MSPTLPRHWRSARSFAGSPIRLAAVAVVAILSSIAGQRADAAWPEGDNRSQRPIWSPNRPGETIMGSPVLVSMPDNTAEENGSPETAGDGPSIETRRQYDASTSRSRAHRVGREGYVSVPPRSRLGQSCDYGAAPCTEPGCPTTSVPLSSTAPLIQPYAGNNVLGPTLAGPATAPDYRVWAKADGLFWWMEGSPTPPLVTTGTVASLGRLGEPGTQILFGDERLNEEIRFGGRFGGGWWFSTYRDWAIEGNYLFLGKKTTRYHAESDGDPLLARPFYDTLLGVQNSDVIAFPAVLAGTIDVSASSRLQGAELMLRHPIVTQRTNAAGGLGTYAVGVDLLGGYRFLDLKEDLRISSFSEAAGPTTIQNFDLFETSNQFHGAEVGFSAWLQRNRCTVEFLMKLAMGVSRSRVTIDGQTITTVDPAPAVTDDGGLLALTTNMGRYTQNDFAVIPELGVTLGYDITDRLRATFGYTFIYWSRVARPGDQIDMSVNPTYVPNWGPPVGGAFPEFVFNPTDLWVQGMNAGVEFRF